MKHFIEIRSYTLKSNTREEFHRLFLEAALPLLQRWNFDEVAHGWSLHDANTYYMIRRYDSLPAGVDRELHRPRPAYRRGRSAGGVRG